MRRAVTVKHNISESRDQISKKDILKAFGKKTIGLLTGFLILLVFTILIQSILISKIWSKYAETDRLTVVQLSPNGTWHIEYYSEDEIKYFPATLKAVLFQHVKRCYSKDKATIVSDWTICANLLSSDIQEKFLKFNVKNDDGTFTSAFDVATKFKDSKEDNYIVEPYGWDFIGDIPNTKSELNKVFNVMIFANINKDTNREKKSRINIKFRFLNKKAMMKLGPMLTHNPIGIQITEQKIIEESK